jgi:AbrB family looped-hinge helix DNA binding protein
MEETHPVYRCKVDPANRVVLPADVRRRLGIAKGDEVLLEVDDWGIRITTAAQALKQAQEYFCSLGASDVSMTDELIRERREEAARE